MQTSHGFGTTPTNVRIEALKLYKKPKPRRLSSEDGAGAPGIDAGRQYSYDLRLESELSDLRSWNANRTSLNAKLDAKRE